MSTADREVEAVWRIESARIVAVLARMTGDLGLAEDLAACCRRSRRCSASSR